MSALCRHSYSRGRSVTPFILNHRTRWRCVVNIRLQQI